ncbi:hypothetical protein L0V05_06070 [Tabrizicola sp. J26]|uniref:hypothetical protein n=1 Tax=Alitabrizicola rongguiensis TaxID=2909234 RepID=UPI001F2B558B|nr:hypothetical protein [Tabrizicola rongguiensis]MCF1708381.1 hypothetical protein [Tabrizicola rongguiensis]
MPKLIRLYIVNVAIGFALALGFVAALVWFNVANIGHLVLETEMGWLAFLMLVVSNGIVFAGAQFAIAVMQMAETGDGPRGGTPMRSMVPVPVKVEAKSARTMLMRKR